MRTLLFLSFFLASCQFRPLYGDHRTAGVCVAPIAEADGAVMHTLLTNHFPDTGDCRYTLTVQPPVYQISDQSISDKDFITMQQVRADVSYTLLDSAKKPVIQNTASANGSSAIGVTPYATVVATEKTEQNLIAVLAEQIALHVAAYLDRNEK